MHRHNKVIRIFVSSPFEDMKAERNYLQKGAFRRLRDYCRDREWQFQAVDLRWGISEEATIDQKTMEICLREIERCQEQSPRPNFIVLLGERYGWRPLPDKILQSVAEMMKPDMTPTLAQLFKEWYDLDENQLPEPIWRLKARQGRFWDYKTFEKDVQIPLASFFTEWSALHLPDPNIPKNKDNPLALQRLKMERSATEQEVQAGAFRVEDANEHVFAYLRTLPLSARENAGYYDTHQAPVKKLRQRLSDYLPQENILDGKANWNSEKQQPTPEHLQDLDQRVYEFMKGVIDSEIEKYKHLDEDVLENDAHEHFAIERTFGFSGREKDIETICNYADSDSKAPFVLWGASGTGKSSLLAMASFHIKEALPQAQVISRFIGVTGKASSGSGLLRDICSALCSAYGANAEEIPEDPAVLESKFRDYLALATEEKPLILFIDALDQLSEYDPYRKLNWLPRTLPDNVKIVLSSLEVDCLQILRQRQDPECILNEILPLTSEDGSKALDAWLHLAHRTLQEHQREQIIRDFASAGCAPLYLHLAFDRALHWESFSPKQRLGRDIPEMIEDLYTELSRPEAHGSIVEKALTAIRCAKQGLSDDEILGVMAADDEFWSSHQAQNFHAVEGLNESDKLGRRIPPVYWIRLYHELEYYLSHRSVHGTEVITFYHRQLAEAVNRMYLPTRVKKLKKHAMLADYFAGKRWLIKEDAPLIANIRKCDELPWQRIQSDDWDAVVNTLCDLDFVQAKAAAKLTYEMVDDFNTALKLIPDNEKNVRQERERQARMHKYIQDLIACAEGKIMAEDLDIPQCVTPWTEMEIEQELIRKETNPNGSDALLDFVFFLGHEASTLQRFAETAPDLSYQQAWNYTDNGAVGKAVAHIITQDNSLLFLKPSISRPKYNPLPQVIKTLKSHTDWVFSVSITPNGKRAISGSQDNTCIFWCLESGKVIHTLRGHTSSVYSVSITPDGKRAISGSGDKTCILWDLETGGIIHYLRGHTKSVNSVSITPDGNRAISGSDDNTCILWDLESCEIIHTLRGHTGSIFSVSITPDGKRAVSGSQDNSSVFWDLDSGKVIHTLKGHTGRVKSVSITPDGKLEISGSEDKTCILWDLDSGAGIKTFTGDNPVSAVSITPDGKIVISAYIDRSCNLWDMDDCRVINILSGNDGPPLSVSITPDGRKAISGTMNNTCILWNLEGSKTIKENEHAFEYNFHTLTPNGKRIISSSEEGVCKFYDLESGEIIHNLMGHTCRVTSVSISPDGKRAISSSMDKTCILWDLERGEEIKKLRTHPDTVFPTIFTFDGKHAFSVWEDETYILWDMESGAILKSLKGQASGFMPLRVTPDGKRAVSGSSEDNNTHCILIDLESGEVIHKLMGHKDWVTVMSISPDGKWALSGSWDHTCILWDLNSGKKIHILNEHTDKVTLVSITQDGKRAISHSDDKTCILWDLVSGKKLIQVPIDGFYFFLWGKDIVTVFDSFYLSINRTDSRLLCPGIPIITARELWDFDEHGYLPLSADCPICGHRFPPEQRVIDTINNITVKAALKPEDSPCLSLPKEAWDDPGLLSNCPNCGEALKFNPFFPAHLD